MPLRLTIVLVAVSTATLLLGSRYWRQWSAARQVLEVSDADLNLGEVWLSDKLRHNLTIRNRSPREVQIAGFSTSCACTAVSPSAFVLPPRGNQAVSVVVDLAKIVREHPTANQWPITLSIRPLTNDQFGSSRWQLSGSLRTPLASALPEASAEPVRLSKLDAPAHVTFSIRLKDGFRVDNVVGRSEGVSCTFNVANDGNVSVALDINPETLDSGPSTSRAGLCLRDWRGRSLPPIPLQVGVFIDPSVVAEPSVVLLPDLRSRRTVLLTSVNERRFKLLNVGDCEGFTLSVPGDRDEYVMRREVTISATTVKGSGAVVPLRIGVKSEGAEVPEVITVLVRRPTTALAETAFASDRSD